MILRIVLLLADKPQIYEDSDDVKEGEEGVLSDVPKKWNQFVIVALLGWQLYEIENTKCVQK